jgi:hypothetical protein
MLSVALGACADARAMGEKNDPEAGEREETVDVKTMRRIAFVVTATWILFSPAYVQIFGGRENVVRAWRMYHRRGVGICTAEYYADGRRVDRYALLGQRRADAPDDFRRISDEAQARAMARHICEKFRSQGQPVDVRLTLRCGVPQGLQTVLDREVNLCAD